VFKISSNKQKPLIKIGGEEIKYIHRDLFIKYLVVPLGSKRIGKLNFLNKKVIHTISFIAKIFNSGLSINQICQAYRNFITTKLHYIFENSIVLMKDFRKINKYFRKRLKEV
jgi:hypothetical protein